MAMKILVENISRFIPTMFSNCEVAFLLFREKTFLKLTLLSRFVLGSFFEVEIKVNSTLFFGTNVLQTEKILS